MAEDEVDGLQDQELTAQQDQPEHDSGYCLADRCRSGAEPSLDPVLDGHDDFENALQQDGREQGEGEGFAEHLGDVLDEQVQDDHVDEDVNNRCRGVRLHLVGSVLDRDRGGWLQLVRGVLDLIRHVITVDGRVPGAP